MVIFGDIHTTEKEPFKTGQDKLLQWILDTFDKDEEIVFVGDWFDNHIPYWDSVERSQKFFQSRNNSYVIEGNHDIGYKGSSLVSLNPIKNVTIISKPIEMTIEGLNLLMLPYRTKSGLDEYKVFEGKSYDYILGHFDPPYYELSKSRFNWDNIQGIFILGHIHNPFETTINKNKFIQVGIPQVTQEGEQSFSNSYIKINGRSNYEIKEIPKFMTIEDVMYGDEPVSKNNLLNIIDAPSSIAAYRRYPTNEYFLRKAGIKLKEEETSIEEKNELGEVTELSKLSLNDKFLNWGKSKEKNLEIVKKGFSYLS
jgi:DNA repair exonuclease SbcCD nuclease subunit